MGRRTVRVLALVSFVALILPGVPGAFAETGSAAAPVHVVESGDTLWQIAQDAGSDVATLMRLNDLQDGDVLVVGRSLKLPSAGPAAVAAPASVTAGASASTSPRTYTVADGDTLWSIAQQLGTNTAALIDANKLDDPDRLAL